jgi:hypothetical protein
MSGEDVFDALDDSTEEPGMGGSDYADWWDPDDAGEELVGVIVELHSAPEDWTEPGDVPDTIRTVLAVGRGDHDAGDLYTPKQHKQLMNGLSAAGIGDLVKLKFTGYDNVNGNMMHTYEVGVLEKEAWLELDGADAIEDLLEAHEESGGISGDNRRTEPYTEVSSSSGSTDSGTEAANALSDLVDIQGGSMPVDQADQILNDVRELDADVETAAAVAGLTVEDGVVKQ